MNHKQISILHLIHFAPFNWFFKCCFVAWKTGLPQTFLHVFCQNSVLFNLYVFGSVSKLTYRQMIFWPSSRNMSWTLRFCRNYHTRYITTRDILPHLIYYCHTWYITTPGYISVDLHLPDFSVVQSGGKLECELDIVFLQRLLHLVQLLLLAFLGIMVLYTIYCNVISCNVIVTHYQSIAQNRVGLPITDSEVIKGSIWRKPVNQRNLILSRGWTNELEWLDERTDTLIECL